MKICAIICEFNPFHNGHKYLLDCVKEQSGCDYTVCLMSGHFTQRGDIAVADKYTRAKHAVLCGADLVLELPVSFCVAPAEIFASGAVKLLTQIPDFSTLAFGCECGDLQSLINAAELLGSENETFRNYLRSGLDDGLSHIKSRQSAFEQCGGNAEILSSPNNVLAIEYIKAINKSGKKVSFLPVKRFGSDYKDETLKGGYSSASAIRKNLGSQSIKDNLPECVYSDVGAFIKDDVNFRFAQKLILSRTPSERLKDVYGCGEGIENALKSLEHFDYDTIIREATSKRYSSARIKRILTANFLGLKSVETQEFLENKLYFTPLAVKKQSADILLSALSHSDFPLLTSGSDESKLSGCAKKCKNLDNFAQAQWSQITGKPIDKFIII